MVQERALIELNTQQLDIETIYKIIWSLILKLKQQLHRQRLLFCPHTVKIRGEEITRFENQNCDQCLGFDIGIQNLMDLYKYQLCGIFYFLIDGQQNLNMYYQNLDFFFFKDLTHVYDENEFIFRSIFQILEFGDYERKQNVLKRIPALNKPQELFNRRFQRFQVITIDPCLGTPPNRLDETNIFFLNCFQNLLLDLKTIQIEIGHDNPLPAPCFHNIFISNGFPDHFKFRINIYYTSCRCQNFQLGTILYGLLTMMEFNQNAQNLVNDDDPFIRFSRKLIRDYSYRDNQQLQEQYDKVLAQIQIFRSSLSQIVQNVISASFYANLLRLNLRNVADLSLWEYYKILFLQEMIELIENKIIMAQSKNCNILIQILIQLKTLQFQRIRKYLIIHPNNNLQYNRTDLLGHILEVYRCDIYRLEVDINQVIDQQNLIQESNNQLDCLYCFRKNLYQKFSQVENFNDPNNGYFRQIFRNLKFNKETIIEFENNLQNRTFIQ